MDCTTTVQALHWLTVNEAMRLGGWTDRQGVLAAIRRGTLRAENINPHADPRRFEYRTTAEWVLDYLASHKRGQDGEVSLLRERLLTVITDECSVSQAMED